MTLIAPETDVSQSSLEESKKRQDAVEQKQDLEPRKGVPLIADMIMWILCIVGLGLFVYLFLGDALRMPSFTQEEILISIIGYIFSIAGGWVVLGKIVPWLFSKTDDQNDHDTMVLAAMIGVVERSLYTTSVILPVFFPFTVGWLALKSAKEFTSGQSKAVANFYAYLLGTALSFMFGIVGGVLIQTFLGRPVLP